MERTLNKKVANKTLKATPVRHQALRVIAAESGGNLLEVTDMALAIGIRELKAAQQPQPVTTPN